MKKILNIAFVAVVTLAMVGCYNDFGIPDLAHVYTDADFVEQEIVSIKSFKYNYRSHVGNSTSEEITNDWVIRGKVISSDENGAFYKSLYIQDDDPTDGRAAIELRLYASNYVKYPMGSMVYVKLKGLSVGDYSGMISVGARATDPTSEYQHTTLEGRVALAEHIFLGEYTGELTDDDLTVIDERNYATFDYDSNLACLIRVEGATSTFGISSWGYKNTYPNYFSSADNNFTWYESYGETNDFWVNPPMAYKGVSPTDPTGSSAYFYGSAWYTFAPSGISSAGQFVVRLSAYARFKDREIPANGTKVNITAILTQFGDTYQIVPRSTEDIVELD